MNIIFDKLFIKDNELLFIISSIVVLLIILITFYLGVKESKK